MPANDSLKRLGGGRWETRGGRFAIEPQSGTWVVVDNEQTDELGLPLVRGPFGSLTAAREAIEAVRTAGPAESPLAGRLKEAERVRSAAPDAPGANLEPGSGRRRRAPDEASAEPSDVGSAPSDAAAPRPPAGSAEPPPPSEPKWLRDLKPADRRRARDLIERLEELSIADPESIAKAEIALNEPALAALAIERSLRKVMAETTDPTRAVRAAATELLRGRDRRLDVRWRLVDGEGRPIADLDLSD